MASQLPQDKGPSPPSINLRKLRKVLDELFRQQQDRAVLVANLLKFAISLVNAGGASLDTATPSDVIPEHCVITDAGKKWGVDIGEWLLEISKQTIEKDQVVVSNLSGGSALVAIGVPVSGPGRTLSAMSTVLKVGTQPTETFVVVLQLIAACFSLNQRGQTAARGESLLASQLHKAVSSALAKGDPKVAGPLFAVALKDYFQADSAMLAFSRGAIGGQSLLHSSLTGLHDHSPQMKAIKQVVAECTLQKSVLSWPIAPAEITTVNSFLLRDLATELYGNRALCLPLLGNDGEMVATVIVCWNGRTEKFSEKASVFIAAGELLAGLAGWLSNLRVPTRLNRSFFGTKQRAIVFLLLTTLLIGCGFLPVSFKVTGNCVLQPLHTRYVVAQFDGILKEVYKVPGSRINKGELLAAFDAQIIQLEVNSLLAEIEKSKKVQDVHVATGKTALAQMAGLERRGLEEKLRLYRDRLSKLSIVSPVDGVVISDNLERTEGSPINRGQPLFEIAPLEKMVAEAHISQEDIGYIRPDAGTTISLDPFPQKSWSSSVHLIFPRAEIRDGRNVFLVESLIENPQKSLRPGMEGRLSITVGKKPLLWKMFRQPWIYFQKTFLSD